MIGSPFGTRPPQADSSSVAPEPELACASLHEGQDAMQGDTCQHKVRITNPQGFHLRPAKNFVELARRFASGVTVSRDGRKVDGKSMFEMMQMLTPQGEELLVEASGPDAHEALRALVELIEASASEEDDPELPLPQKG